MPDSNFTPGPTPELPLTLSVDGALGAVDFVKRLHRAGLQLVKSDDGSYAVLQLAGKDPCPGMRERLFEAQGIVASVRYALTSNTETDADALQDALAAAERIIDNVAAELEGT